KTCRPRVGKMSRFLEFRHRLTGLTAFEERLPFDQLAIVLQFRLELRIETRGDRQRSLFSSCLDQSVCGSVQRVLVTRVGCHDLLGCGDIAGGPRESGQLSVRSISSLLG